MRPFRLLLGQSAGKAAEEWRQLAMRNVRQCPRGRDLIREGERTASIHFLIEGWAYRYKQLRDGRRQILSFCLPGEICDTSLFVLERMDHSLGSVTQLEISEISRVEAASVLDSHPALSESFRKSVRIDLAIQRERTMTLGQRSALERVAHLMCELFVRQTTDGTLRDGDCPFPLTQAMVADATGLTQVHVNRTIQDLRRQGLIDLQSRRLRIKDLSALASLAHFDPAYLELDAPVAA